MVGWSVGLDGRKGRGQTSGVVARICGVPTTHATLGTQEKEQVLHLIGAPLHAHHLYFGSQSP